MLLRCRYLSRSKFGRFCFFVRYFFFFLFFAIVFYFVVVFVPVQIFVGQITDGFVSLLIKYCFVCALGSRPDI